MRYMITASLRAAATWTRLAPPRRAIATLQARSFRLRISRILRQRRLTIARRYAAPGSATVYKAAWPPGQGTVSLYEFHQLLCLPLKEAKAARGKWWKTWRWYLNRCQAKR